MEATEPVDAGDEQAESAVRKNGPGLALGDEIRHAHALVTRLLSSCYAG